MTWREHQQCARISRRDLPERLQQHCLFAIERAAGNQRRTDLFPFEGRFEVCEDRRLRRRLHFELQVAADVNMFSRRSHPHQAARVFLALRQEELHVLQHAAQQLVNSQIAGQGAVGDTRIHHGHGCA